MSFVVLCFAVLLFGATNARFLLVPSGYANIQAALDVAEPSDEVVVSSGNYT